MRMRKQMNKKGQGTWFFISVGIFFLIVFGFFIIDFVDYIINYSKEIECFQNIAEEYCQERGYKFYETDFKEFRCIENREVIGEFGFTEQERETCFVWDWFPD